MEIHDLEQELRDETLCDISNIKIKKVDGKLTIFIDEFRITETEDEDMFDVSDTLESFESFETNSENVVEFFTGFYDAFEGDAEDDETNQYYTLGFGFGNDAFEDSIDDNGSED